MSELKLFVRTPNEADAYVYNRHLPRGLNIGYIDRRKDTFISIPRDRSNLFHLFADKNRTSGLGINNELLQKGKFTFIEIPYEGRILKTTKEHFLKNAIPSPYHNEKVDFQRILQLKDFFIPEKKQKDVLLNLFEEVS